MIAYRLDPETKAQLARKLAPPRVIRAPQDQTVATILDRVSTLTGVHPNEMLNRGRRPDVAEARKVAMWLLRQVRGDSYPAIARAFGRSDHRSIMSACQYFPRLSPAMSQAARAIAEEMKRV